MNTLFKCWETAKEELGRSEYQLECLNAKREVKADPSLPVSTSDRYAETELIRDWRIVAEEHSRKAYRLKTFTSPSILVDGEFNTELRLEQIAKERINELWDQREAAWKQECNQIRESAPNAESTS